MALKGKSELIASMEASAANMQKVRKRKEAERSIASQSEAEPRSVTPVDLTRR